MKRIFLVVFVAPLALAAAEVSRDDAAIAARAWVDRGYAMGKLPAGRTVAGVDEVTDPDTGAQLRIARFSGGGFVVLSANDLVDPVIAFSETGTSLDLDADNPFWALLRGGIAAREAGAGIVRGETASGKKGGSIVRASSERTDSQRKWASLLRTGLRASGQGSTTISDVRVEPLIKSRWNQLTHTHSSSTGLPCYNYYTPNGYPCGCGATSFAQIMRYFQWPTNAIPAKSYSVSVDNVAGYRYMIGGPYDWANMPLRPWEGEITEAQREAIGRICHDTGVVMNMMYKESGSSSYIEGGRYALVNDFCYSNAVSRQKIDNNIGILKQCVIPSLDAKSPVVIGIRGNAGGHFVNVDGYGYSGDDWFIHVNAGWGSATNIFSDVWYCPPDLNMLAREDYVLEFEKVQDCVYNIFPERTGSILSGRVLDKDGRPVARAVVSLPNGNTALTDENGIYALVEDVSGDATFTVTAVKGGVISSVSATLGKCVTGATARIAQAMSQNTYLFVQAYPDSSKPGSCGNTYGNDIILPASASEIPVDENDLVEPVLSSLAFGGTDANPIFTVSVGNAVSGIWYTFYETDNLANGFISTISTNASLDGLLSVPLDASDPAKFVIVKPSLEEVAPLSPLP